MKRLMSPSILLALMALAAANLFAASNDEQQVRQVVSGFAECWNRHDMQAFGRLFAPDADFVNVAGDWWKGRAAIEERHAYAHGTIPVDTPGDLPRYWGIFKDSTLRFTQIDVRFLRKDVAVAHVSMEMLGDARTPSPRHTTATFILTREDSGWLIAAGQNTEINRIVQ
jgi:uncharacterized protein (TIGR02246 family)